MSWNDESWARFSGLVAVCGPGEFTDAQDEGYRVILDDVEPEEAVAALRVLSREPREFRPSAMQIRGTVEQMRNPVESFEIAWQVVHRAIGQGYGRGDDWVLKRIAETAGLAAAAWASAYGLERLRVEPVDDPEYGGAALTRMRRSYVDMTARTEDRDRLILRLGRHRQYLELASNRGLRQMVTESLLLSEHST